MFECTLCSEVSEFYYRDEKREWDYYHCNQCDLVFRDPKTYLMVDVEKARYETHNNSIENEGYVRFLSPAVNILLPYIDESSIGLDYGCGPGPIIDILFSRHNIVVENYDPIFHPTEALLDHKYDFVTCTEVIEHMYNPGEEFLKIKNLLKAKGLLVLMTDIRPDKEKFASWGYRMDNTHVCFYSESTLSWLADKFGFEILKRDGRTSLLKKF